MFPNYYYLHAKILSRHPVQPLCKRDTSNCASSLTAKCGRHAFLPPYPLQVPNVTKFGTCYTTSVVPASAIASQSTTAFIAGWWRRIPTRPFASSVHQSLCLSSPFVLVFLLSSFHSSFVYHASFFLPLGYPTPHLSDILSISRANQAASVTFSH